MKVVIINGSPRNNGSTAYILHELEEKLIDKGVEVIFYNLSDQDISLCNGCSACFRLGYCVIEDDANTISKEVSECDGLIIGSSTMESNVTGLLKMFMDRSHFVLEQFIVDKYAIAVSTYENYGGKNTNKIIKDFLSISGANISGSVSKKIVFNNDLTVDVNLNKKINRLSSKLYNDIKTKNKYPIQLLKHKIVFKVGIKPFIFKNKDEYKGVLQHWKSRNLI